jgi:hypothetical protein
MSLRRTPRQRRDRLVADGDVVRGRVRPGAAAAHHRGQRLVGVVQVGQQRVVAEPLEVRLGQFLIRVRLDHGGVQPDTGHLVEDLVRDPHPRQPAVPGGQVRPRRPPGGVHRRGDPP